VGAINHNIHRKEGRWLETGERSTLSDYEDALVILAAILIGAIAIRILFDRAQQVKKSQ